MRKTFILLLLTLSSFIASAQTPVKVVSITDGDTFTILDHNKSQIRIRIYAIDAPESSQDYGQAAKKHLSLLLKQGISQIENLGTDKYGRLLARIYATDGTDIGLQMIKDGFAWHYDHFDDSPQKDSYAQAQKIAKKNKLGLWKQPPHLNLNPYLYRKSKKN